MRNIRKNLLRAAGLMLALVLLAVPLAACSLKGADAKRLRKHTAISSENFSIDGAMMAYIFFGTAQTMAGTFSEEYLKSVGFDENKKLSEQYFTEGVTWLDLFMNEARADAVNLLILCEEAKRLGFTLTSEDEASISSQLYDTRANIAIYYGKEIDEYLAEVYSGYVAEEDIRNMMRITTLASKAEDAVNEQLVASITDAEIEAYGATLSADKKDTTLTRRLGTILFNPDEYTGAELVSPMLDTLKTELAAAAADGKAAAFEAFAEKYDVSGTTMYENVAKGDMLTVMDEWLYDSSRKIGDLGIVASDYGYHILYYVADDDMAWVADAKVEIYSDKYEEWRNAKIAGSDIKEYDDVIAAIDY